MLLMFIPKASLETLVAKLNAVDKVSRLKKPLYEDLTVIHAAAIKAVRAALTVLRKAKRK